MNRCPDCESINTFTRTRPNVLDKTDVFKVYCADCGREAMHSSHDEATKLFFTRPNQPILHYYKPLQLTLHEVTGTAFSLHCMLYPKEQIKEHTLEEKLELASRLIKAGDSHAKAIRGIRAEVIMHMQTGFMIEFETYRHGVECLSTTSSMHGELKGLTGEELADKKQSDLPDKVYKRGLDLSYQALRNIYKQRRYHRHPDWQIFCDWIETLPYFKHLIYPEYKG